MIGTAYCSNGCGSTIYVGEKDGEIRLEAKPVTIMMNLMTWCEHHHGAIHNDRELGCFCSPVCMVDFVVKNQDELKKR